MMLFLDGSVSTLSRYSVVPGSYHIEKNERRTPCIAILVSPRDAFLVCVSNVVLMATRAGRHLVLVIERAPPPAICAPQKFCKQE